MDPTVLQAGPLLGQCRRLGTRPLPCFDHTALHCTSWPFFSAYLKGGCAQAPLAGGVGGQQGGLLWGRGDPRRLSISHHNSGVPAAQGAAPLSAEADNDAFFQNKRMHLFFPPPTNHLSQ